MVLTKKQLKLAELVKQKLIKEQKNLYIEEAHYSADDCLCELLKGLGFDDIVKEYRAINKYYI